MLLSKRFVFIVGCLTTSLSENVLAATIKDIACGDPNFSVACSLIDSCAGSSSSHDSSHDASDDGLLSTDACGTCKGSCSTDTPEFLETEEESCKGQCMNNYGWDACPCGDGRCEEDDHGGDWNSYYDVNGGGSMEECGNCKQACHDADSEATPSGPCKGNCMDTFGTTNCPCGNDRCIVGDESSHSHDTSSDEDQTFDECYNGAERNSLPGTEECGDCKTACHCNDSEETPSGPCKGACGDTFGITNCMCGPDRCTEEGSSSGGRDRLLQSGSSDQTFDECFNGATRNSLPGTEECGDCKVACSCNDSEETPSGPCKGACSDTFGATNCMCGNNRCIEGDESSHSHDGSSSSSSDESHSHGENDPMDLPGTHYEDTRPCGACKSSCSTDNPEFLETEDAGCKSQCHTAYDPFCTCGGAVCGDGFEGAEGPYTVFLPTDAAFAELDSAVGGLANVDTDVLCGILEFHVVAEKALSSSDLSCEIGDGSLIGMANGVNSRVKCTKDVPYGIKGGGNDKPANFVDVDIQASDGYVHVIDNVLFYPAVLDSPFGQTSGGENVVPSFRGAIP